MSLITDLIRDLRYAGRSLLRTPGFTVVAVVVLALGIGATSAIFSVVSAVWLRPLPFADEDRLVSLWVDLTAVGGPPRVEVSPGNYADWRERAQSFESMAAIESGSYNLTGDGGEPERLTALNTTSNLFVTIGLAPLLGRTFTPADDAGEPVVVISEGLWTRRFGGDPSVVGRTITLNDSAYSVVGVVPRDFRFPGGEVDVFVPTVFAPEVLTRYTSYFWYVVAKLRPGATLESARAEMASIEATLDREFPDTARGMAASVVPLRDSLVRGTGFIGPTFDITLKALVGAVALVLLIACANVANLMLARATARHKELAIRKALGAARGRMLRQLLTESAVVAGISALLGLGLAAACLGYLTRLLPGTLPVSNDLALDWRVLALTVAAAFVTVLLFGAGPAFAAARRDFGAAFGRALGAHGAKARRLRTTLVVAEIALTVVLLVGAGLLLRSYRAVLEVDPGFDAEGLLVATTVLPESRYPNPADYERFYRSVLEEVRALPGVESAGYTSYAPLVFKGGRSVIFVDGRPRPEPAQILQHLATNRSASPGYLETLRVPLISGRFFDERDVRGAARSVVINESLARRYWSDGDPIGQRISVGGGEMMTVVGVVGDVRQLGLDLAPDAEVFVALDQIEGTFMRPRHIVVRTSGDPLALATSVRNAVWSVDPDQPVSSVRAMSEVLDTELANRNTQLTLIGSFAVLALVLAAVGLYGTLSYTVSQSANEIGLRMALGAKQMSVVGSVVRSAMATAVLGIGVGLAAAYALTRTISALLFGVSPTDPFTALAVAGVLLAVAALAGFVPARRAASIDPAITLRAEA